MSDSSTAATQVVRYLALGTPLPGFCFFKVVKGCLGRSYALNRIQPVHLASCTHPIPRVAVSLPLVCTFGAYILVEAPSFSLRLGMWTLARSPLLCNRCVQYRLGILSCGVSEQPFKADRFKGERRGKEEKREKLFVSSPTFIIGSHNPQISFLDHTRVQFYCLARLSSPLFLCNGVCKINSALLIYITPCFSFLPFLPSTPAVFQPVHQFQQRLMFMIG